MYVSFILNRAHMDLGRTALLLIVGLVVVFFLFQIGVVVWDRMSQPDQLREHLVGAIYTNDLKNPINQPDNTATFSAPAPVATQEKGRPLPEVPGQTEEELRLPEPTQRQVRRMAQADEGPGPVDERETNHNSAGFGEQLRHPEASFQAHPLARGSMQQEIDSGRGATVSSPGLEGNQQPFASDLAQNGGELMKGIFAFDSTESNGFSTLF